MEQFNLEKYLENPSRKIVTRSGHNVRILCTDQRGNMPIVALVEFETLDGVQLFYHDGKNESHREYDLFFADEGKKLTKFEKTMILFSHERNSLIQFEHTKDEINAHLYLYSKKLRYLARKEILKDLPKWKKNLLPNMQDCTGFNSENFCYKGYYINYQELFGILQKEE